MKTARFSREKLLTWLWKRHTEIATAQKFDSGNGWSQVVGQGEQRNRDYGEWRTLEMVARLIESGEIGRD